MVKFSFHICCGVQRALRTCRLRQVERVWKRAEPDLICGAEDLAGKGRVYNDSILLCLPTAKPSAVR